MRQARCFHCGSKRRRLYRASLGGKSGIPWRVLVCREHRECPDCDWMPDWAQPWKEAQP